MAKTESKNKEISIKQSLGKQKSKIEKKVDEIAKKKSRRPMVALICVQGVALLAFVIVAVVSGAWFRDSATVFDTVTMGTIDVEWVNAEGESYSDPRDFVISENAVISGSEFAKDFYIKNIGNSAAYLRAKIIVFVNTADESEEPIWQESGLWVSPTNLDYSAWYQTSDGYYYYKGLDTVVGGEDALYGCIYPNTYKVFATNFIFANPLPDSLLNKRIKVQFLCETIQDRNDAMVSSWASAPAEWLYSIGETPDVYILPSSSANHGVETYQLSADPQTPITLRLDNLGVKSCFVKIDVDFLLSNDDLPGASILSFTTGEDVTYNSIDGKYYYEYLLANGETNRVFTFTPVVNTELDISGVTYNVVFHIESLTYDESVTLENEFFADMSEGFSLPGVRSGE